MFKSWFGKLVATADQLLQQGQRGAIDFFQLEHTLFQSAQSFAKLLNIQAGKQGDRVASMFN